MSSGATIIVHALYAANFEVAYANFVQTLNIVGTITSQIPVEARSCAAGSLFKLERWSIAERAVELVYFISSFSFGFPPSW